MNSGALAILDIVRYIMVNPEVNERIGRELRFVDEDANKSYFDIALSPNPQMVVYQGNLASIYDAIAVTCTTTAYCMLSLDDNYSETSRLV